MSSSRAHSEEVEFSFGADPEGQVLFERFSGRLTPASLLEAFKSDELGSHYRPGIRIITDFTDAVLDIPYEEMRRFIHDMNDLLASGGGVHGRAAMVAESDVSFGNSRMYEILTEEERSPDIRVFRDWNAAVAWLEVPDGAVDAARERAVTIKLSSAE